MSCAALAVALVACVPANEALPKECTASADCPDRGFCVDGQCEPCSFGLPEASAPCLAENVCGNEIGVGQTCSRGGGECSSFDFSEAIFCTIDFVPDAPLAMCTRPCVDDDDCGASSVCQGDPADPNSDRGCVPAQCASEGEGEGEEGEGEGEGE